MIDNSEPMTVVVAQQVKPGQETAYEDWIRHITTAASGYAGYLGTHVIRPQTGVRQEYVIIFRFDTYDHLKAWMTCQERQYWLEQAQPLVESDPQIQQISGIEAWFSIPGQPLKTPPRYKTALLTWAVVFILINLLNRFVTPILQEKLPPLLLSLLITGIMVALLTYVIMPRVNRAFKNWLYGSPI